MRARFCLCLCLCLLLSACGSSNSADDDAGTNGDGSMGGDGGTPIGQPCAQGECGSGSFCATNPDGESLCLEEGYCTADGSPCTQASECCSLACNGGQCGGDICTPEGDSCENASDCCSNSCEGTPLACASAGTGCKVLGERVTGATLEEAAAGCCSLYAINVGTETEPDYRCNRASDCGSRGDLCINPEDCCSGFCLDGRCPTQNLIGGARVAGEPCVNHADCSTYACASNFPGGPKVCQDLGGCKPAGEICGEDWECCGYYSIDNGGGTSVDGMSNDHCRHVDTQEGTGMCQEIDPVNLPGLRRCNLLMGDKEVGEICKDAAGVTVHNCCLGQTATQDEICQVTATGVFRCGSVVSTCLPDGEQCSIGSQCCNGVCSPGEVNGMSSLVCGGGTMSCLENGTTCTASADCCSGYCDPNTNTCGTNSSGCSPLGGSCQEASDCCDQGNICSSSNTCAIFVF